MHTKIDESNLIYTYENEIPIDITLDSDSTIPSYAHAGDAGMDLVASADVVLTAFTPQAVSTGIKIAIPMGYEGQVRPRSGLSLKGVTVYNAPGTINAGATEKIKVILIYIPEITFDALSNIQVIGNRTYEIRKGDSIAQLIVSKYNKIVLNPVLFLK